MSYEKTSNWIAISGFLLAVTIIASWGIDVSISALTNGGLLTNGFFLSNPMVVYHLCLYMIVIIAFSHFLVTLHVSLRFHHRESSSKSSLPVAEKTTPGDSLQQ